MMRTLFNSKRTVKLIRDYRITAVLETDYAHIIIENLHDATEGGLGSLFLNRA